MQIIITILQVLASLSSLLAAVIITFRPQRLESLSFAFPQSGLKRIAQAVGHWTAFIATLLGISVPFIAFFASCVVFVSAIPLALRAIHIKSAQVLFLPTLLVITSIAVAILQPLGLKVLALPKADELTFNPSQARVIKTYDEGLWFEGIAAGDDGTLYLSANRGLDFSRADYYHNAEGELIARKPDGSQRRIFKTPHGLTSGVPLVMHDNSIYLTSHGDTSYIWHIDAGGKALRLAQLPGGAWPNGLDIGPDGMLYSPDSSLGVIWKVDPKSGQTEIILRDPALRARRFISLAPGANGLHFKGRDMLVSVSDRTTILRYSMNDRNQFNQRSSIIVSGIPGDDFAIGEDSSLFITTHPYNTIVRVFPGGKRTIIGKAEQHIVGATDAVFGKTAQDKNTLYVVTDGGAFTGGPKTRGELIALYPYLKH
ncbi:MAG: SMP-30/gluconolactonase/LRE family protein [Mucilaginibacter sp.]